MTSEERSSILTILSKTSTLSLATIRDGKSYINTAFYAYDDEFNLYFLSNPKSQHVQNLKANPSAAATVFDSSLTLADKLAGLQVFGTCTQAKGTVLLKAFTAYTNRFLVFHKEIKRVADLKLWGSKFYCLKPEQVKILDEETFGVENWKVIDF